MWGQAAEKVVVIECGGQSQLGWWESGDWSFFLMAFYQVVVDLYAKVSPGQAGRPSLPAHL